MIVLEVRSVSLRSQNVVSLQVGWDRVAAEVIVVASAGGLIWVLLVNVAQALVGSTGASVVRGDEGGMTLVIFVVKSSSSISFGLT